MTSRLLCSLALLFAADAAKILIYNPLFGQSHVNFISELSIVLQDAGHDVTLLVVDVTPGMKFDESKFKNVIRIPSTKAVIESAEGMNHLLGNIWVTDAKNPAMLFAARRGMHNVMYATCKRVLDYEGLFEKLAAEKFDLGIAEYFDVCGVGIYHQIGLNNTIVVSTSVALGKFAMAIGSPLAPSYVPGLGGSKTVDELERSMLARFGNAIETGIGTYLTSAFIDGGRTALKERFPDMPDTSELAANCSLVFTNTEPLLNFPQPTIHKVVDVGGIGVPTPKKLNKEWDEILSRRSKTVLISFGSVAKSVDMPLNYKQGVAETIKKLNDVTFIWKYEQPEDEFASTLKGIKNLVLSKWTPQNDLLNDGRLSAFVTHGGMGSVTEASLSGTPLIAIGLFGDQLRNGRAAERHGSGAIFDKEKLASPQDFQAIIRQIIEDPSYKRNANKLANLIRNRPFKPKEIVTRYVNFVATQGPIDVLNPAGARLTFAQYYLLDVAAVVILVLLSLAMIIVAIAKRCIFRSKRHQKKE